MCYQTRKKIGEDQLLQMRWRVSGGGQSALQFLGEGDLILPAHCDERKPKEDLAAEAATKIPETPE